MFHEALRNATKRLRQSGIPPRKIPPFAVAPVAAVVVAVVATRIVPLQSVGSRLLLRSRSMGYSTVLLIGARGYLGSQILDAIVKKNKYKVSVLIRPGSNADKIEAMDGVTVVRGDMMDKESLVAAMDKVDVVVNSANGYGVGHPEIDTEGATNVVDACKAKKVKRYVKLKME